MVNTTLCYIEKDGQYLMLHRVKKQNDVNKDKWIGVGGGFEEEESPEDCLLREVREETGLTLMRYALRGIVTFVCACTLVAPSICAASIRFMWPHFAARATAGHP